jgi:hypothetical protein
MYSAKSHEKEDTERMQDETPNDAPAESSKTILAQMND